jgi:hypothetical protein
VRWPPLASGRLVSRSARAEHYVFPSERYGAAGDKFCAKAYDPDPTKPIGRIKEGGEATKLRAARILEGEPDSTAKSVPLPCRFHDLRHTAVSRMLNAGFLSPKLYKGRRMEHGDDGTNGWPLLGTSP